MKNIIIGLIVMVLIFSLTGNLLAEQKSLELRPGDKELFETEPRQIVSATFRVQNNTQERRELEAQVKLPEEWNLITREFPFELGPKEGDVRLVSFFVPQKALAGKYEVTYLVQDRKTPEISDFWTISVFVLSVAKLEVQVLEAPDWIIAGKDYTVSFLVINGANAAATIIAEIESRQGWPAVADSKKFQLGAGETKIVKVVVKSDAEIHQQIKHYLKLTARAPELKNGEVEASATAWVDVIPRIGAVADRFHKIPTEISLRGVMEQDKERMQGFQSEISGSGTLDEQGRKHIDFLLREPDIRDKSVFGEYDEFHFSHWTDEYQIFLGDKNFSLSPLTEQYQYGRGIEGKLNLDKFTLGWYGEKTRWPKLKRKEFAGYINYLLAEKYCLGFNYLQKEPSNDRIFSFRTQLEPFEAVSLELEGASGTRNNKRDNAYFLRAIASPKGFLNSSLQLIHAGPNYSGYYRDTDLMSSNTVLSLWSKLGLNVDLHTEKHNLELNPTLSYAPAERSYRSGLSYNFRSGTRFSLGYQGSNREDRLPEPKFNYQERTFLIDLWQRFSKASFWVAAEKGSNKNNLNGRVYELKKYRASVFCQPLKNQHLSGYIQVRDEEGSKRVTAGLNVICQIKKGSSFNLDFQSNWRDNVRSSDLMGITLEHRFLNNYHFLLRARRSSYRISTDLISRDSFSAELSIPFGIPMAKKKGIGQLTGVLYDTVTGERLKDVVIRVNGVVAVTDKNGNFKFPALEPGKYYLEIDRAGIGLDRISVQKMPLEVIIEGGRETNIGELGVVRSANLKGRVVVYKAKNNQNGLSPNQGGKNNNAYIIIGEGNGNSNIAGEEKAEFIEAYGLPNILVEVKDNAGEVKRRVTDTEGRFEFEELRPGEWTLKAYDTNLPEYHYFEKDVFELALESGEKNGVLIKVLPQKRTIRIIKEGGVLEEK